MTATKIYDIALKKLTSADAVLAFGDFNRLKDFSSESIHPKECHLIDKLPSLTKLEQQSMEKLITENKLFDLATTKTGEPYTFYGSASNTKSRTGMTIDFVLTNKRGKEVLVQMWNDLTNQNFYIPNHFFYAGIC